jgi:hypothetical protein
VTTSGDSLEIVVENEGRAIMPVALAVTRAGGQVDSVTVRAEAWLDGERRRTVRIAATPAVRSIEIDPDREFPDVDRSNQVWPR